MTLIQFLVVLAQFSVWATTICSARPDLGYPVERVGVRGADLQDVAPLADDAFVIVARGFPSPGKVDIEKIDPIGDELVATIEQQLPGGDAAPSVIASGESWWMSRVSGMGESLFFVTPKGTRELPLPMSSGNVWFPAQGPQPRGLFVHVDDDSTLRFDEATPSGLRTLGQSTWPAKSFAPTHWAASVREDGSFVVVARHSQKTDFRLWILPGDKELSVPCDLDIAMLRTAADESGHLGIAAFTLKREIVAAVVDLNHPEATEWVTFTTPGEYPVQPWFGVPAIAANGKGFIIGWIRDDGVVRACELNAANEKRVVLDVGTDADTRNPLRQLIHVDANSVTFIWKGSSGECYVRRLPNELAALGNAIALRKRVCDAVRDRGVTAP